MKLLYSEEHLSCFQYENRENPAIEHVTRQKDSHLNIFNEANKIVFVLKGSVTVSFDSHVKELINKGRFYFVPAKCQYNSIAHEDTEVLLFRMNMNLNFCDHFSFEMLLDKNANTQKNSGFTTLETNFVLQKYLESMEMYLNEGLKCFYLFELKQKELLFLLRAYFLKEELFNFFNPVLSPDIQFSNKVYEYCEKVKTSKELAECMNYSLSGFEKRFKRVFGMPAYKWLKTKKARNIYHEITCTKKTFSEIGFEYGFSSSSYFNDFCKTNFGKTPGEIRNTDSKSKFMDTHKKAI